MSVAKTIEVVASSTSGIEDAVRSGVTKVGETVKNIEGAWVKDTKAVVRGGSVAEWRVTLAVTFLVD
jgi:flavin-binding protein dodecin